MQKYFECFLVFGLKIAGSRDQTRSQDYNAFNDEAHGSEVGGEIQLLRQGVQELEPAMYQCVESAELADMSQV